MQNSSIPVMSNKLLAWIILGVYIVLRMMGDPVFWSHISEYYAYAFEVFYVLAVWWIYRCEIRIVAMPKKEDGAWFLFALVGGIVTYMAAGWMGILIPFNLSDPLTIFLLLIWAPLLEEAIFHMALWQAFKVLCGKKYFPILATTILFALGYFSAYFFVPEPFHKFVLYQTFYVILLGFVAGWRRWQTDTVLSAIFVHFGFNLGFFLASHI